MSYKLLYLGLICSTNAAFADVQFGWKELLGRVTDHSVTVHAVPDQAAEVYFEYGQDSTALNSKTTILNYAAGAVVEVVLDSLHSSTAYYYRMRSRASGTSDLFASTPIHSFHTQRQPNEAFRFDIQADPHLDVDTDSSSYFTTQMNIQGDRPDFLIDLGDNFLSEKYDKSQSVLHSRLQLARSWYDHITHSIPLFLTIGNHEGELGWLNNGKDTSFAVRAAKERLIYYPNPYPDGFFSGDTSNTLYLGKRESWYSWVWGDALFVVLDPYWFAEKLKSEYPERGWDFTLGIEQYNWLSKTLRESRAKYKFIFAHQLVGGDEPFLNGVTQGTGRGGAQWAHLYEMGGFSKSGSYDWSIRRPGWEKPLHDLFVETGVNVYFHGHDHLFAVEEKDGVIYQECPQPGLAMYTKAGNADVYGYTHVDSILPNSGHMRINVHPDSVHIEYIRSFPKNIENPNLGWLNGSTAFAYTLKPKTGQSPVFSAIQNALQMQWSGKTALFDYTLGQSGHVTMTIMDLNGRAIFKLFDAEQAAGAQQLAWNTESAPAGEYIALLNTSGQVFTQSLQLH